MSSALAPVLLHASWSDTCGTISEDIERVSNYAVGGYHPVALGDLFHHGRYQILHKLGAGGEATVWLVLDRLRDNTKNNNTNKYASLKILTANASDRAIDPQVYQRLKHTSNAPAYRFICPLLDQFHNHGPHGRHLCLVMPLGGPNIVQSIQALSRPGTSHTQHWDLIRRLLRQVVQALALLHSNGIVHGGKLHAGLPPLDRAQTLPDFTPSNILTKLQSLDSLCLDDLYNEIGRPRKIRPMEQGKGCTP